MLTKYLTQTTQLLQNPPAQTALYRTVDLTGYINTARGQLAGESECIRVYGTLALVSGTRTYNFSSIALNNTAVAGVFNIRGATIGIGDGQSYIRARSFPWFQLYKLNNVVPQQGIPTVWSQYSQGVLGSIYVDPVPDIAYTLSLDCVCYPIDLVDDTTVESIPFPYTDAIPYYAAYMAYLSSQRADDAEKMFKRYSDYVKRARQFSNSSVLPNIYPQSGDPTLPTKLGVSSGGAQ